MTLNNRILSKLKIMNSSYAGTTGVSLRDHYIRRILAALKNTSGNRKNFIILKKDETVIPKHDDPDMQHIRQNALKYLDNFSEAGKKRDNNETSAFLSEIIEVIVKNQIATVSEDFSDLGLHLICVDDYEDIAVFIEKIIE